MVDVYDKEKKLNYTTFPEKYTQNIWKRFQMSGQGPYFGQRMWFGLVSNTWTSLYTNTALTLHPQYHPEKIQSAIDRYDNEIRRVYSVIEFHLNKTGTPYLVGDKCTFADLMWVPWTLMATQLPGTEFGTKFEEKYPKTAAWHRSLLGRESVKRVVDLMNEHAPDYMRFRA